MEDISSLMLKSEKERAVVAETVQNGVQVIDGGEMKLIVNPILGYGSPSLFLTQSASTTQYSGLMMPPPSSTSLLMILPP